MTLAELKTNEEAVTHALRVAADTFRRDAETIRTMPDHPNRRLADQFERQADAALELAERIEEEGLTA